MERTRADHVKYLGITAAIGLAYFGTAVVGYALSEHAGFASPIWLPSGIALAALLVMGLKYWPGVALGAMAAAFYGMILQGVENQSAIGFVTVMVGANNTMEAALTAWLINRFVGWRVCFGTFRNTLVFLGATFVACLVAGILGAGIMPAAGLASWSTWHDTVFTWWIGDVTGILILLPVLLPSCNPGRPRHYYLHSFEFVWLLALLYVSVRMVFTGWLVGTEINIMPYIVIPILMWAVIRLGLRPAGLLLLYFTTFAAWYTMAGHGPFVRETVTASVLMADGFIVTNAVTIMLLASVISNLQQSEESLLQSEEQLNLTIESAGLGIWSWHIPEGRIDVNEQWERIIGYEPGEMETSFSYWEHSVHEADFQFVMHHLQAHLNGTTPLYSAEYRIRKKDGEYMWMLSSGRVVERDDSGHPVRATGIYMDISGRKEAEQALHVNQFGIEQSVEAVLWIDEDGQFRYGNQQACRSLGYGIDELLNIKLWEVDRSMTPDAWARHWDELRWQGSLQVEGEYTRKDGTTFPVEISENYLEYDGDTYNFAFVRDISIRKQYETTLTYRLEYERFIRDISTRFANAAESEIEDVLQVALGELGRFEAVDYCYVFMLESDMCTVSQVFHWSHNGVAPMQMQVPWDAGTHLQWIQSTLRGGKGFMLSSPHDLPPEAEAEREYFAAQGIQSMIVVPIKTHDVTVGTLGLRTVRSARNWSHDTFNLLSIVADTFAGALMRQRFQQENTQLQAQLLQSQKMESIGTLAGGVAHEINNPINIIMNYAELVSMRKNDAVKVEEYAQKIIGESDRVATIVRDLLAFSRQDQEAHSPTRIGEIVDRTVSLMRTILKKDGITLVIDTSGDIPPLACRAQHIQQVLMNLLTNARDALNMRWEGEHPDKQLKITVQLIHKQDVPFARTIVEDTGGGIPADVIDRIFDPFFTTKPRDEGTGLGLSVSHGIVKDHGGDLMVESTPGKGTRFYMDLPLALADISTPLQKEV